MIAMAYSQAAKPVELGRESSSRLVTITERLLSKLI